MTNGVVMKSGALDYYYINAKDFVWMFVCQPRCNDCTDFGKI